MNAAMNTAVFLAGLLPDDLPSTSHEHVALEEVATSQWYQASTPSQTCLLPYQFSDGYLH